MDKLIWGAVVRDQTSKIFHHKVHVFASKIRQQGTRD
jgi:hypothetical protein